MAKGDELLDRLINFAVMVIRFCSRLPKTYEGRHIAQQLLRSGTAPAPHYGEARSAESTKDFLHKLKLALKEMNESKVWIEIVRRSEMLSEKGVVGIATECDELCKILNASVSKVRSKM